MLFGGSRARGDDNNTKVQTKLQLGAFDCTVDGWINTDVTPHIWVSRIPFVAVVLYKLGLITPEKYQAHREGKFRRLQYLDLTRPFPIRDESVSAVFSSHVFEHLYFDEVFKLIREIHRVLAPGGICRTVVPDLEKVVSLFDPSRPEDFVIAMLEVGKRTDAKNQHHCGFTKQSLRGLFKDAGFRTVEIVSYKVGRCPDIEILDNRPDSIFVEAIK